MQRMRWQALLTLVVVAALAPSPAPAAVVYQGVAELTTEAGQIVIGDVVEVTSDWDDTHELIKSRIVVSVDHYLVGEGGGTEVLEMSGGTVGDVTLHVSVLPVFEVGDHLVLFLGDSEIRLVGSFQGAYLTDGEQVARMAPSCGRIIEDSVQPLSDFLDEIEQALPPGTALPEVAPYGGGFQLPFEGGRYSECGYDWTYKSDPMGESYRINANCADSSAGDADSQITQIQNGMAGWNDSGADFSFTYGGTSTQTAVDYNGTNLIYFDTTPPGDGDYVAANYHWSTGGNMTESDIVFNDADYTWWNGSGGCSGKMDIWNVATHELGHTLCLGDLYSGEDSFKTMYGYVSSCETLKRTLHSDDIDGIVAIYGSEDTAPPTPNPMSFATPPAPTSEGCMIMTATLATDADSPPVRYYFNFVSGGSGGDDSSFWQVSTTHGDCGLTANTYYTYRVKASDSAPLPNETAYSPGAGAATYIETPQSVSFGPVTTSSIVVYATGTLTNLELGASGVYFDSTTTGGDGGINEWIQTTTDTATGLGPDTNYSFRARARNQDAVETDYTSSADTWTLANTPAAPILSFVDCTSMDIDVLPNGNPPGTAYSIRCASSSDPNWNGQYVSTAGTPVGSAQWQYDGMWGTTRLTGMQSQTGYTFRVKARNRDDVETEEGPSASLSTSKCGDGDLNDDGTVDLHDFVLWQVCFDGWPVESACEDGDFDGDGSIDLDDFAEFTTSLTGPS